MPNLFNENIQQDITFVWPIHLLLVTQRAHLFSSPVYIHLTEWNTHIMPGIQLRKKQLSNFHTGLAVHGPHPRSPIWKKVGGWIWKKGKVKEQKKREEERGTFFDIWWFWWGSWPICKFCSQSFFNQIPFYRVIPSFKPTILGFNYKQFYCHGCFIYFYTKLSPESFLSWDFFSQIFQVPI